VEKLKMKLKELLGVFSALCLCTVVASAEQETTNSVNFEQRLKQMQEMFEQR